MAADQNLAQVMLVAAHDAPLSGKFSQLTATLADPNNPETLRRAKFDLPIDSRSRSEPDPLLDRTHTFARDGRDPEGAVHAGNCRGEGAASSGGGQMSLKVIAKREGDFKAPIKIELILNPNGVNSSREISIAEGQNEALISINAAGNAQVKEHKIAVRGEATVGSGPIMVCSPFVSFRVAEPYLKFKYEVAAVEQGAVTDLFVKLETPKAFEGNAKVQLLGLPNKVTTTPAEFNKDAKELVFKLKAEADAAPGVSKSLFCQVVVTENGEPIIHNIGTGQLRVDKPLPPKEARSRCKRPVAQASASTGSTGRGKASTPNG